MGGSGYALPTRPDANGKPSRVVGVTTALGSLDKGGITQWAVDQTVAYCVTHVDDLLSRTEEQGFNFARFFHKRKPDFDDNTVDLNRVHSGVLDDLAELGTVTHDWVAAFVSDMFEPDITRDEQAEMVTKFLEWWAEHDVQVVSVEATVVGDGYAGTLDHIWIIDGVPTLVDVKTSRAIRDSHYAQLAALGAAESMMVEVAEGEGVEYDTKQWGKTYWREVPLPAFSQYAILQLRPDDVTSKGEYLPAFCKLHVIPNEVIDTAHGLFLASLHARQASAKLKTVLKTTE